MYDPLKYLERECPPDIEGAYEARCRTKYGGAFLGVVLPPITSERVPVDLFKLGAVAQLVRVW